MFTSDTIYTYVNRMYAHLWRTMYKTLGLTHKDWRTVLKGVGLHWGGVLILIWNRIIYNVPLRLQWLKSKKAISKWKKLQFSLECYFFLNMDYSRLTLFFRSQTLLLDRRMFLPRRHCYDGPKRPLIGTPESRLMTSPDPGGTASPSMPLFTETDLTWWIGKSLTEDKYGRELI